MRDTESEPPPTLSASELATLETEAERWSFDVPKDLDRLAAFLESAPSESNARVVSTWFLARQLHGSSDDATRIPDTVHRVDLRNGSALYARSVRRDDETVRITTLTGIETTLPSGKVQTTTEIRRDAYLSQTRDDFTKDLAQLDRQRVSDVESGLRRALRRRDLAVADELFRDWIAAGGPARLAKRTSRERHPGVHLAVAHLAPTLPSTPDVASSAPTKPSDATSSELPPRSLEDLATRIDAVYRKTRNRRVAKKDVERWVDAVAVWEEWLERRVADNGVTENVNDLRQRLQHLRLDLLKMSGF